MGHIITNTLSFVSSIITIFAIWGLDRESPIGIKIVLSVGTGVIFLAVYLVQKILFKSIIPIDYATDSETNDVGAIIVKKRNDLQIDTLVTIYHKEQTITKMAAIGVVVDISEEKTLQIDILSKQNKDILNKMKDNQTNIKQYYVVPYVKYIDVEDKFR